MNLIKKLSLYTLVGLFLSSCVSKQKFLDIQSQYDISKQQLADCDNNLNEYVKKLDNCMEEKRRLENDVKISQSNNEIRQEQLDDLKSQISDLQSMRDKQVEQVGDLTVLSQSANENIKETLSQLEGKDKYIQVLQAARTKADSINLALAVNLKSVLSNGISDSDIEVKVDKTVVFINLSDKMLYQSGSYKLTPRAYEVLEKIAKIIQSRPGLEVMVEGYTDNQPISKSGIADNWDLSVLRSTSVVRVLQKNYSVDPNRLIAAGRGEYNALADNSTSDGRSINRRTRIILLPKINEFYDLLNPDEVKD